MEVFQNQSQGFSPKYLVVRALIPEFDKIREWIVASLAYYKIAGKPEKQILIAADEIFTNIANYAYGQETGKVKIVVDYSEEEKAISFTFIDSGVAYNPLTHEMPDIEKRIAQKTVGGLGIMMVRKLMSAVTYERIDNQNILTIKKKLG